MKSIRSLSPAVVIEFTTFSKKKPQRDQDILRKFKLQEIEVEQVDGRRENEHLGTVKYRVMSI